MNKQPIAQPNPAVPGAVKRPKPIRVVKGPDGKPRLVRRGAAAYAALQANVPKVLRIGVIQGARIVEERILRQRDTVYVGNSEKQNAFILTHASVGSRFPLFELRPGPKGGQFVLNFADEFGGRVAFPESAGGVSELAALRASNRVVRSGRVCQVPLTDDCKGKIVVGDTTLLFQFVVPPPIQPPPQLPASVRGGWINRIDTGSIVSYAISLVLHTGLLCGALIPDWPEPTLEEILDSGYSVVNVEVVEMKPEKTDDEIKDENPDGDTKANETKDLGAEATATTTEVTTVAVEGPTKAGNTKPQEVQRIGGETISANQLANVQAKIENSLNLENILGGGDNGPVMGIGGEFDGQSASVANLQDALQGAVGTGEGTNGASTGYTSLDGNLATGPTVGQVGETGTQQTGPAVVPTHEQATKVETKAIKVGKVRPSSPQQAGGTGRMGADAFRSALGRKRGAIETCYNRALVSDPTLSGDLTFLIVINQQGTVSVDVEANAGPLEAAGVTSCIVGKLRTLNFASSPPQGGDFRVRLPISFIAP